ncbi:imidazole glycerol phosphate synthase subunit HisH [Oceanospirillum beijerinckii]|uniref:imidazole glycerol phosphate synthase subunit HisH n=1 Tax=Oceanospirillum beijerinckii TaxID=64976 RepID=UPI0004879083|nr:imidazole glycerol phosphate synthase subunit HisH [Oceanospirillum beijerinckii]
MVTIVDLGIGNIGSISKVLRYLGVEHEVVTGPDQLAVAEKIILPGVGSFSEGAKRLDETGFRAALLQAVQERGVPLLGICVGMQLLARTGFEGGECQGLGLIDGVVSKIDDMGGQLQIPHMGWNDVKLPSLPVFDAIPGLSCFYFVHSYAMLLNEEVEAAYAYYGQPVLAFVNKNNIYGVQFHPEKSQQAGLTFLRNFVEKC